MKTKSEREKQLITESLEQAVSVQETSFVADTSAVTLIVGCYLLACSENPVTFSMLMFHKENTSSFLFPQQCFCALTKGWCLLNTKVFAPGKDDVASYADVLRLVTRSSPQGEESVTSLRTST